MKLDELKDLVTQCMSTISQCDVGSSQALKDLRGFHEALLNDLPNEKVVSDGITEIKLGLIFEDEYDFLPYAAKVLVTRLVHLFGKEKFRYFNILLIYRSSKIFSKVTDSRVIL